MSRKPRRCPGGLAYHVMNRATARETIFAGDGDYAAFERVLAEAREREAGRIRVCAYALMPNHFHLVLWPQSGEDEAVSGLMKWLTLTHAQRWHAHRHTAGTGALYGSRFKSFPVREDWHFLKVCRYVERNPLRANLVERAELWPWCSLNKRLAARRRATGGDAGGAGAAGSGGVAGRVAGVRAAGLAGSSQCGGHRRGTGGVATVRASRPPVR